MRDYLVPRQEPWLGEYDDSQPATVSAHLKMSRQANIRLWVSAWFGPGSASDTTMINNILKHPELHQQMFAIHYETNNRLRNKSTNPPTYDTRNVVADMTHLCNNYFKHPNYFRINGRPVMALYLSRAIDAAGVGGYSQPFEFMGVALKLMRDTALSVCGESIWIVGDQIFNTYLKSRDEGALKLLDAITG